MHRRRAERRTARRRIYDVFDRHAVPFSVLLVDAHEDTRTVYGYVFEDAGYHVTTASDAEAGFNLATVDLPDLIFTELALPRIDGFEFLTRLQNDPATCDIALVVLTSLAQEHIQARARACGATVVVHKPAEPATLISVAEFLLNATSPRGLHHRQVRRSLMRLREIARRSHADSETRNRLRRFIDRLQIAVLAIDDNGRFVAASRAATHLTGYSHHELLTIVNDRAEGPTNIDALLKGEHDAFPTRLWARSGEIVGVRAAVTKLLPGLYAVAFARAD